MPGVKITLIISELSISTAVTDFLEAEEDNAAPGINFLKEAEGENVAAEIDEEVEGDNAAAFIDLRKSWAAF